MKTFEKVDELYKKYIIINNYGHRGKKTSKQF